MRTQPFDFRVVARHATRLLIGLIMVMSLTTPPGFAQGQTKYATEEHFHDLFITAGYSTAFGAALGAAFLGLTEEPLENLRYVAMGASMGFIAGSVFGTYILIAPALALDGPGYGSGNFGMNTSPQPSRLTLQPAYNLKAHRFDSIRAHWQLASF